MANPGVNLAVTTDGGAYNKLPRPDDYLLMSTACHVPISGEVVPHAPYPAKRKRGQDVARGSKRVRAAVSFAQTRSGNVNDDYNMNMKTALPGGNGEEQLSDNSTNEALAYICSVRSEASTIPRVLVATTSDNAIEEDQVNSPDEDIFNTSGEVYDRIDIGLDRNPLASHEDDDGDATGSNPGAQQRCYKLLLRRFQALRDQILSARRGSSYRNVAAISGHSSNIQLPSSKRAWLQTIERGWPSLDHILQIDDRTLYLGLQSCASSLSQSTTISREKSCWIWSLMASAGELGVLDRSRISKIRDLGLQAGRLSTWLRDNSGNQGNVDGNVDADSCDPKEADFGQHEGESATVDHGNTEPHMARESSQKETLEETDKAGHLSPGKGHGAPLKGDTSQSEADMSMSENEDKNHDKVHTKELEQARARLLAQLGDRLVQPGVPSSRAEAERLRDQAQGQAQSKHIDEDLSHETQTASLAMTEADWNTKAAIDMILTVAAECYGQKDLLSYREAW